MKNYKIITLIFVFILSIFFIINQSIDNDASALKKIKFYIPDKLKIFLKETVFIFKYKQILKKEIYNNKNEIINQNNLIDDLISRKILIKSTSDAFSLEETDSIFIYQKNFNNNLNIQVDNFNNNTLMINSYNKENKEKEECLRLDNIKKYYEIKINKIINSCKESYFFQGIYNKKIYFYFALKNKELNLDVKNLLVIPVATFFDYSSNINDIRLDHDSEVNYMHYSNEVPTSVNPKLREKWPDLIYNSIINQKNIFKDFNIINDYQLETLDLNNFDNIILPMHQESISVKGLENLLDFLNKNKNKNLISIGGANLLREVNYFYKDDNLIKIEFTHNFINWEKYNLNVFTHYAKDKEINKIYPSGKLKCEISDEVFSKKINLGEIMFPFYSKNTKHYFYNIVCPNIKLPMLSIINFNSNKFIQINSDGIGANLLDSKKLTEKILETLGSK